MQPQKPTRTRFALAAFAIAPLLFACGPSEAPPVSLAARPGDTPALHHTGLNSVDPEAAIDWYIRLWPEATRASFASLPALDADMDLVFTQVDDPPQGAFREALGRPLAQSAFWHIGAFANTTGMDESLSEIEVGHLPLFVGPGEEMVWRSGLAPYAGVVTEEELADVDPAEPRPGGFSYVLGPDGALFELTGGPNTTASLSHVHFFHEEPRCAANWYVSKLGMTLPPIRNDDGTTSPRQPSQPCEVETGPPGWPSLEQSGTLRQPRATVVHANGSMSFYPRQCVSGRCVEDQPLVPSRGQVLDHVGFTVEDVDAWHGWLTGEDVVILDAVHDIPEGRAFMFEGPDRLAIEFVQLR